MRITALLQIILLSLQIVAPGLHVCLGGECGEETGLHGPHDAHYHDAAHALCLESPEPPCEDLEIQPLLESSQRPSSRLEIPVPVFDLRSVLPAGLLVQLEVSALTRQPQLHHPEPQGYPDSTILLI